MYEHKCGYARVVFFFKVCMSAFHVAGGTLWPEQRDVSCGLSPTDGSAAQLNGCGGRSDSLNFCPEQFALFPQLVIGQKMDKCT